MPSAPDVSQLVAFVQSVQRLARDTIGPVRAQFELVISVAAQTDSRAKISVRGTIDETALTRLRDAIAAMPALPGEVSYELNVTIGA